MSVDSLMVSIVGARLVLVTLVVHSKLKSIARSPCHYYLLHKGQLFTNATSLKLSLLDLVVLL